MKTVTCKIDVVNGRVGPRVNESKSVEEAELDELLGRILDQLILGNHESRCDDTGALTSRVIGAEASPPADDLLPDGVGEHAKSRHLTVNVAGIFGAPIVCLCERGRGETSEQDGWEQQPCIRAFQNIGCSLVRGTNMAATLL